MPVETVVTETTIEPTEAERAAEAARLAEVSAVTLAAQVENNAANEIREHQEAVETLEGNVSWLKTEMMQVKAAVAEIALGLVSFSEKVTAEIQSLRALPTPQPQPEPEIALAIVEPDAEAVRQEAEPKSQQRTRRLI